MSVVEPVPRVGDLPHTASQRRIIAAALELFADHGVGGTSLQMIADSLGVTKAALYHQFRTKEDLILAATQSELSWLQGALDVAEVQATRSLARETLLAQLVHIATERRGSVRALHNDPVIARLLAEHAPFRHLTERLYHVLAGNEDDVDIRVPVVMLVGAIGAATTHPFLSNVDNETLRSHLLAFARQLLSLPTFDEADEAKRPQPS
jgi:AcrR family transcriptional regulator